MSGPEMQNERTSKKYMNITTSSGKMYSEEEVREKILTLGICNGPYDSPHRCSALHCNHCGLCDVSEELLALVTKEVEAQKQALLREVLEEAEEYEVLSLNHGSTIAKAVPVEAIQALMEGKNR
jgi:hypothetical protein